MVLAAPLFLATQTAAFRAFYAANREPLFRLGLGSSVLYLSLRLLSKTYESTQLAEDLERVTREKATLESHLVSPQWLSDTVAGVCGVAPSGAKDGSREAALLRGVEKAREASALSAREAAIKAAGGGRTLERWLGPVIPKSGVLEAGRVKAAAVAEEVRSGGGAVPASSSSSSSSSREAGGGAGGPSSISKLDSSTPLPAAVSSTRKLI
jgi:hypothetical protein